MTHPVVLIDVDGVVLCQQGTDRPDVGTLHVERTHGFYKPGVWLRMAEMINPTAVEGMWLTSWGEDAHQLESWLGLPNMRVLPWMDSDEWWKFTVVKHFVADFDGPVVWIDDYIKEHRPTQEWLTSQDNVLALSPSAVTGLTMMQVEDIFEWLGERYVESIR